MTLILCRYGSVRCCLVRLPRIRKSGLVEIMQHQEWHLLVASIWSEGGEMPPLIAL